MFDSSIFPVVDVLSTLTLIGGVLAIAVLIALLIEIASKKHIAALTWISTHALLLTFIVAVTATSGSLFFSEIAGWAPCKDCWLQRIFMYPQVVLLGMALWKKDRKIFQYILALCIIGGIISIDHYAEQIEATFFAAPADSLEPCDASGVSCAKTYTFRYGYITIPMMALTAFVLNALGSIIVLKRKN